MASEVSSEESWSGARGAGTGGPTRSWRQGPSKWSFVWLWVGAALLGTATAADFSLNARQYGLSIGTVSVGVVSLGLYYWGWRRRQAELVRSSLLVQMLEIFGLVVCIAVFAFFKAMYPAVDQSTKRLCTRCSGAGGLGIFSASECAELCESATQLENWPAWLNTRLTLMTGSLVSATCSAFFTRKTWLAELSFRRAGEVKKVDAEKKTQGHAQQAGKRNAAMGALDDFNFGRRSTAGGWARRRATTALPVLGGIKRPSREDA